MGYVDGYVAPVPKNKVQEYRKIAQKAGKVWMDHGALQYVEAVGEDLKPKGLVPFGGMVKAKRNETVIFAWVVFKSRAHRDKVNAAVMKDPRIASMTPKDVPFDHKRMVYGGFKIIVEPKKG